MTSSPHTDRAQTTAPLDRRLVWEGCFNARDLGGYPTASGLETRWGAYIRADSLTPLTEAGKAGLVAYGVRTIVDLRLPQELAINPSPFASANGSGMLYRHVSLVDPSNLPSLSPPRLADEYKRMLANYAAGVGRVMNAIAEAPPGGVLYHCEGGRDRTGLVSAFLLELAGVPRQVIGADYGISSEYLRDRTAAWIESDPALRDQRAADAERLWTRPEVILEVLDDLDQRSGGVAGYLRQAGVNDDAINRLRARLLPSTPAAES